MATNVVRPADFFKDSFLQNVANIAGKSNTVAIPKDQRNLVKSAIIRLHELIDDDSDEEDAFEEECWYLSGLEICRRLEERDQAHQDLWKDTPSDAWGQLSRLCEQLEIAIAPHKSLPHELLSKIFTFVKDPRDDWYDILDMREYEACTLREICSRWRDIAMHCRGLWSKVSLALPHHDSLPAPGRSWTGLVQKITETLPRTGPISLNLAIEPFPLDIDVPYTNVDDIKLVESLIVPLSERLNTLELICNENDLQDLLGLPPTAFPSLKSLRLSLRRDCRQTTPKYPSFTGSGPMSVFHNARQLHDLNLAIGRYEQLFFCLPIAHSHLSRLNLSEPIRPIDVLTAIANSTQLTNLRLNLLPQPLGLQSSTITLPQLTHLNVSLFEGSEDFFDGLQLPSLSFLSIDSAAEPTIPRLISMISRSKCPLKAFEDSWDDIEGVASLDDFTTLLSKMTVLEELRTDVDVTTTMLQAIASGEILPQLQQFVWSSSLPPLDVLGVLEHGLECRVPGAPNPPALKKVEQWLVPFQDFYLSAENVEWDERASELKKKYGLVCLWEC